MNEKIQSIIHDPKTKNVAIGVGVVAGITGVVYVVRYIKRRRAEKTVVFVPNKAERAKMEIDLEDIPILYESSIDQKVQTFIQDKVDNRLVSESLIEAMITGEEPEEVIMQNVFTQVTDPEWDYEEEVKNRKPSEPYIIHRDEFFSDEMDFLQSTFTYYAGDNILIDEDDTPIYNHEIVTGPLNFGHGSGDSNVIYIRNEKRKSEYEILRDPGLYSTEVLGLEIENNDRVKDLKHAASPRKFRPE